MTVPSCDTDASRLLSSRDYCASDLADKSTPALHLLKIGICFTRKSSWSLTSLRQLSICSKLAYTNGESRASIHRFGSEHWRGGLRRRWAAIGIILNLAEKRQYSKGHRGGQMSEISKPEIREPDSSEESPEFLLREYGVLKDLYSDSVAAAQSQFNFYLTILSAIVGGVVFTVQVGGAGVPNLGIFGLLLGFAVLIGVIYQSSILDRYADQARYATAIAELKVYLFSALPDSSAPVYQFPVNSFRLGRAPAGGLERLEYRLWWALPVGTFQLVITFVTSMCLVGVLLVVVIAAGAVLLWQMAIASVVVFGASFMTQFVYANVALRRRFVTDLVRLGD